LSYSFIKVVQNYVQTAHGTVNLQEKIQTSGCNLGQTGSGLQLSLPKLVTHL
jgi:hypothetical protein